jgi:hypothetical protein
MRSETADPVDEYVLKISGAPAFVGPRKFEPSLVTPELPPRAHAVVAGAAAAGVVDAVAATIPAAPATAVVNRARRGRPEGADGVYIDISSQRGSTGCGCARR